MADPLVGRSLDDKYTVRECIGRGAMGSVYVAEQTLMKRDVALKVLHPEISSEPTLVKRFFREARAAGRLSHSNTITVHEVGGAEDGTLYYSMELLRGRTLAELLQFGPVEPVRVVHMAVQVARSLAEAHEHGLVHRDLKPENLYVIEELGRSDMIKVLDFGMVKILDCPEGLRLTRTGSAVGTLGYISPEAMGAGAVGRPADLYSLGVVVFELLTGTRLFVGKSPVVVAMKHINESPPTVRARNPRVVIAPALQHVIDRLLSKDPAGRPESAAETVELLLDTMRPEARRYLAFADTEPIVEGPVDERAADFAATQISMPEFDTGETSGGSKD